MERAEQELALLGLPDVALGQLHLLDHLPDLLLVSLHVVHAVLHLSAPPVQHLQHGIEVQIHVLSKISSSPVVWRTGGILELT